MGIASLTDIQQFAADMAREFSPEKVVLFGSYASGNAGGALEHGVLLKRMLRGRH